MSNNLNFTFYDTISYLVPGLLLIFIIDHSFALGFDINTTNALLYIVISYIVGAILNMLSLFLYRFIDTKNKILEKITKLSRYLTIPVKRIEYPRNELLRLIKEKYNLDFSNDKLGLFVFADTTTSESTIPDKDVLITKEGFFRNLTVVVLIAFFLLFKEMGNQASFLIGSLCVFELCYYGREYFKEIKNQKIYMLAFFKLKNNKTI